MASSVALERIFHPFEPVFREKMSTTFIERAIVPDKCNANWACVLHQSRVNQLPLIVYTNASNCAKNSTLDKAMFNILLFLKMSCKNDCFSKLHVKIFSFGIGKILNTTKVSHYLKMLFGSQAVKVADFYWRQGSKPCWWDSILSKHLYTPTWVFFEPNLFSHQTSEIITVSHRAVSVVVLKRWTSRSGTIRGDVYGFLSTIW